MLVKDKELHPLVGFASTLLIASIVFLPVVALAQHTAPKAPPPSNRYLLIVETSRSMQKRLDGTLKSVQNLLTGGFGAQLQRYDTIGLWTFDQQLHTGVFPLQTWSQEGNLGMVKHILTFLQQQKYGKTGNLTNVVPTMNKVIENSGFIMVILISSGEEPIQGTPFDGPINDYYRLWQADQAKAHMPFVTVLRAKKGKVFDYVVSPAPWPVEIPPLPADLRPEATNQVATAKKAPRVLPPLIVSGHKSEPAAAAPAEPAMQPQPVQETGSPVTSNAPTKFLGMVLQTTPVVSTQTVQMPLAGPSPTPAPVNELNSPAPAVPMAKSAGEAVTSPANSASVGSAVMSEKTADQPPSTQESTSGKTAASAAAASPAPTSEATATPPAANFFGHKAIWAVSLIIIGLAGLGLYLGLRTKRPAEHTSLITRSFEKDR